jgi:hypothetical protein
MKNKTMVLICSGSIIISTLSFAQVAGSQATAGELAAQKATFNQSLSIYNNRANKEIRAKELVDKKAKSKAQDKKRVQNEQEEKNGLVEKNGLDEKNQQYDKQLTVKF